MGRTRSVETITKTTEFFNTLKGKTLTSKDILDKARDMKVRHNLQKFAIELGWCIKKGKEYEFADITFHPNLIVQLLELSDAYNRSLRKTKKVKVPNDINMPQVAESFKVAKKKHDDREKKFIELSESVSDLHANILYLRNFISENMNVEYVEGLKTDFHDLSIKYNALVDENNELKDKLVEFAWKSLDRMMDINNQTKN